LKPDYLTRIAAQAVQAPTIVPRITARFENSSRDAGGRAELRAIDEWVEAARPLAEAESAPRPALSHAVPEAEPLSMRAIAHVEQPLMSPASKSEPHTDARSDPPVTIDVQQVRRLDAVEPMPMAHAAAEAAPDRPGAAEPTPVPSTQAAATARAEAADSLPTIGNVLRLEAGQIVEARAAAAALVRKDTPARARGQVREPARLVERAEPEAATPPLRVEVNIDRIEVRAMTPAAPMQATPAPSVRAPMSLDEHLRRRRGETV
jgi:hypothetical protein